MRAYGNLLAYFALACMTPACGGPTVRRYHPPGGKDQPRYELSIWVENDPRMPLELVLKGCDKWNVMGVTCAWTPVKELADVRVYADDGECVIKDPKDGKNRTILAWAYKGGDIKMMTKCLTKQDGRLESHQLAAVVTHEVGHQVGVWEHVHEKCDDTAKKHPSGKLICGPAVMRPYYDPAIDYVTEIDALAFDERDPLYSVLVKDTPASDTPDCVYYAP